MKNISGQDARQGRKGVPVLIILLLSLALALIVWVGIELYGSSLSKQDNSFANDDDVPVTTVPSKSPASAEWDGRSMDRAVAGENVSARSVAKEIQKAKPKREKSVAPKIATASQRK